MLKVDFHVAGKFLRPVALLARVLCRPEILDRRLDWPFVVIEGERNQLLRAIDLRLHEPLRTRADVALDAFDPRVRPFAVGYELRVHRGVANLATKRHRLRIMVGLVATERG